MDSYSLQTYLLNNAPYGKINLVELDIYKMMNDGSST